MTGGLETVTVDHLKGFIFLDDYDTSVISLKIALNGYMAPSSLCPARSKSPTL